VADLAAVIAGLEKALHSRGLDARITSGERFALGGEAAGKATAMQAVRALRQALSTFARGGAPALQAAGFAGGLGGFVAAASDRVEALRHALQERRFHLDFQPIVQLKDRSVHHYEALLRPEPARGVPVQVPADLVNLAEMVGLAEQLDEAVFQAARDAAIRSGHAVAFNLSGLSVQSRGFRERLLAALDRPVPGGQPRVLAEITETAEIEDESEAAQTVAALRDRGVPICIDDFGAGAAAFRYLRSFPIDYVKIDGAYVRHAVENERDRGFVAAMIDLSLNVGARTIAEQVESEAVAEIMQSLGVGYGQGWLFGRPGELPQRGIAASQRRGEAKVKWE
jgi:EAL domain-containing protein (putative c-di-GMP-specific phosphodiesterase class I)